MDYVDLLFLPHLIRRVGGHLRVLGLFRPASGLLRKYDRLPRPSVAHGRLRALAPLLAHRLQTDKIFIVSEPLSFITARLTTKYFRAPAL